MGLGVDLFWPPYAVAALVIAAVAVHLYAYRRTTKPIAAALRVTLLGARLAALGLIIFILWRPAAESETVLSRKARLVLLVDSSKSMSIWDEKVDGPPASRLARASAVFSRKRRPMGRRSSSSTTSCRTRFRERSSPWAFALRR